MSLEIRKVPVTSGIVADLGGIDTAYAEAIVYDDADRTSGHVFIWKSSASVNNGTVYAGLTGYWVMQYNGPVNVKWFGAVGNGSVDDYAAINAAAIFAFGSLQKNELYFPAGTYAIGTMLTLHSNVHLRGHSRTAVTIVPYTGYTGGALTISGETNVLIEQLTFNGFAADNNISDVSNIVFSSVGVTNATLRGIYIRSSQFVTVKNCYLQNIGNMGIAVEGGSAGTTSDVLITGNYINTTGDNGIAVRAINGSVERSIVSNNEIHSAGKAGIKNTIESTSSETVTFKDAVIEGNIIVGWGNTVNEAAITASSYYAGKVIDNCSITGNVIHNDAFDPAKTTSYINATALNKGTISGNTGTGGCAVSGIFINTSQDITVSGNIVDGAAKGDTSISSSAVTGGISLNVAVNVTVTGNVVKNSGSGTSPYIARPGIFLRKAKYCTVTANVSYDDQATATQTYGIEESNLGGSPDWSANNYFANNIAHGNITADFTITTRSKLINSTLTAASADTATAAGVTYSQTQVQGVLDELRDLKTKLRTALVLAP